MAKKRFDRFTIRKMAKEVRRKKHFRREMMEERDEYSDLYVKACGAYITALEDFVNHFLEEKRVSLIDHETAKVDFLLSVIYNYPDFVVEIEYEKVFDGYKPDAVIRMWHQANCEKSFNFIIEIERSRKPLAIKQEKLNRIVKVNFRKNFGNDYRVVFLIAHPHFTIDKRPLEYKGADMMMNQDYLQHVLNLAKDLPAKHYRFAAYHEFPNIAEPVFFSPDGNVFQFINQ